MDSRQPPLLPIALGLAALLGSGWWAWSRVDNRGASTANVSVPTEPSSAPQPAPIAPAAPAKDLLATASLDELGALIRAKIAAGASANELFAWLRSLALKQPELAIELAHTLGRNEDEQAMWVSDLTREWTAREPRAAWQWLFRQPLQRLEKLSHGNLLNVVTDELAQRDEKLLLANTDFLLLTGDKRAQIPPQALVFASIEGLVRHGKLDQAKAALETWARDPLKNDVGPGALSTVAIELAKASPVEAGQWLKALPVTDERNSALASLAADWVTRDPEAALKWSAELDSQDGRTTVVRRAYSDWLEEDASKAGKWLGDRLAENQPLPDAEVLIANLVHQSSLIKKDPLAALQWADLIGDPALRVSTQEQLLLRWGARDQSGFERHLAQNTTLPAERKAALMQQVRDHHLAPEKSPLWFSSDAFEK